ncbi:MAG: PIG-L deacetylase family protein [bacterium]
MSTDNRRPTLLFIFAHPDDDAFGPSGSLAKLSQTHDVYFLCATKGEGGENHTDDKGTQLTMLRSAEVIASCKTVGAKGVHFLGFIDGSLCNSLYHQIADAVQVYVDKYQPSILMSWEPRGITGHIDHIVMSMVTHYVYHRSPCVKKLMLFCKSESQTRDFMNDYFIYRPPGYPRDEIDEVIEVSDVWETKILAMQCHKTQIGDMQKVLKRPPVMLMEECFLTEEKGEKIKSSRLSRALHQK